MTMQESELVDFRRKAPCLRRRHNNPQTNHVISRVRRCFVSRDHAARGHISVSVTQPEPLLYEVSSYFILWRLISLG